MGLTTMMIFTRVGIQLWRCKPRITRIIFRQDLQVDGIIYLL
jgi:hypothetical protein